LFFEERTRRTRTTEILGSKISESIKNDHWERLGRQIAKHGVSEDPEWEYMRTSEAPGRIINSVR
jgi:hypothetical protein